MAIYELPIPAQFSGDSIQAHLKCDEVWVSGDKLVITSTQTLAQVTTALATYVYSAPVPPTLTEKLASVGLTIADIKAALV